MTDESYSSDKSPYGLTKGASQKTSGMTQTIRHKLNFVDESLWKKFSARRLELIDIMALSEKKASEQDDDITGVADRLRCEYGYPSDTLADFERLVRAGIQSVRRNRKRIPKSRGHTAQPDYTPKHKPRSSTAQQPRLQDEDMDTDAQSPTDRFSSPVDSSLSIAPHNDDRNLPQRADTEMADSGPEEPTFRDRISISALVSPSAPPVELTRRGESYSPNSLQSVPSPDRHVTPTSYMHRKPLHAGVTNGSRSVPVSESFTTALEQLVSLVEQLPHASTYNQESSNLEYLGFSVLHTAATLAVQKNRIPPNKDISQFVNTVLLSNKVLQSVSSALPALHFFSSEQQHVENIKLKVAACATSFGFDLIIRTLCTVLTEMMNAGHLADGQPFDFFGSRSIPARDKNSSIPAPGPNSRSDLPPAVRMPSPVPSSVASSSGGTSVCGVSAAAPRIIPVTLRFFSQKLDFTYAPGTSTPPTIPEILDNGKNAFHILGDNKVIKIRNLNLGGKVIETDGELAEVFETSRIDLELYFPVFESSSDFKTLPPISSVSSKRRESGLRFQEVL